MASHYIVPAPGQQFAPVVRRVVLIGRSVGENVRIDKSMPTPRLVVGDKTLERWHTLNAARKAADSEAAAAIAQRRADAAAAAAAPEGDGSAEPPAPTDTEPGAEDAPKGDDEPKPEEKAPAKKAAARKRKQPNK
jgi:hypothetical protein